MSASPVRTRVSPEIIVLCGLPDRPHHFRPSGLVGPVPAADDHGIWLGPRHLRLRHRDPEPALGRRPALRRRGRRPVRRLPRALRGRASLCARPRRHGLCHHARRSAYRRRRADRLRPVRLLVQPGARRLRQAPAGEVAAHGLRRRHGGGLLRPVPVPAHRQRADRCVRLASGATGLRRQRAARHAPGSRARDAADRRCRSGGAPRPSRTSRSARP